MKNLLLLYLLGIVLIFLSFYFLYENLKSPKNESIVSLVFDDGFKSQYSLAFPEMQKYNFKGTIYVLANWTGLFEGRELADFEQVGEMQSAGWEIGSHGLNHKSLVNLSDTELENELYLSKSILEKKGFNITSLSFPFGQFNNKVIDKSKEAYLSARPFIFGDNDLNNFDPYLLKSKWTKKEYSPNKICSWVKSAKRECRWLILDFHSIEYNETWPWDESLEDFKKILLCINNSGIQVMPIKEVLAKYGKTK